MAARLCNEIVKDISSRAGGHADNVTAEQPLFYHSSTTSPLPAHQITFKSCIFYITFYAE
ncbi:hypothetical protein G4E38_004275 [Salmonella enterica]|nr:hypothetical protein [Salmonella enterica]